MSVQPPKGNGFRTLVASETFILLLLFALLVAIMIYAIDNRHAFGVSWFSVAIAASATLGEVVRRLRHLRTDLTRDRSMR